MRRRPGSRLLDRLAPKRKRDNGITLRLSTQEQDVLRAILAETEPQPEPRQDRRTVLVVMAGLALLLVCGAAGWLARYSGVFAAILAFIQQQLALAGG